MPRSHESAGSPLDDLEQTLLSEAAYINQWVKDRRAKGSDKKATNRKITRRLMELTRKFVKTAAYIQAPFLIIPMQDGTQGIGSGEVTGEIVGFTYMEDSISDEQTDQAPMSEGVAVIIATGGADNEGVTPKSWEHVIPEKIRALLPIDYTQQGVVPILVLITEDTRFTQISNPFPLNSTVHDIVATKPNDLHDFRDYVNKIHNLMQGRYGLDTEKDKTLLTALLRELDAMNAACPYLGKGIEIRAPYMITASRVNPDQSIILGGAATGILRKFIFGRYFVGPQARGAVQAVLYPPEIAAKVYGGSLSPKEADTMPGTIFVPLDQEYTIRPIDS